MLALRWLSQTDRYATSIFEVRNEQAVSDISDFLNDRRADGLERVHTGRNVAHGPIRERAMFALSVWVESDFHIAEPVPNVVRRIGVGVAPDKFTKKSLGCGQICRRIDNQGNVFQDFVLLLSL